MARFVLLAEFGMLLLGNRGRKWHWDCCCLGCLLLTPLWCFFGFCGEQGSEMRLDIKARFERLLSRISCHLSTIEVQLFPPYESCLLALFHDRLEETTENVDSVAFTDTRQARMVGKRFVQIVSNIPPHAEPISRMAHELPFGPDTLEEHDQL